MILRKGAISARLGERVIIPLNMRDGALLGYEAYHLDETMTITLNPGMNYIEISGYALLSGERSPKKEPVLPESIKLTFADLSDGVEFAITNMYVEKG